MNTIKVGLCFLDCENKPVLVKALKSNWTVNVEHDIRITEKSHRNKIVDEIAEILTESIKMEIKSSVIKEMLEEIGDK